MGPVYCLSQGAISPRSTNNCPVKCKLVDVVLIWFSFDRQAWSSVKRRNCYRRYLAS